MLEQIYVLSWGLHSWMQYNRWGLMTAERENHPLNLLFPPLDAAQGMTDFLGGKWTLTVSIHFFSHQVLLRAALNPLITQPVSMFTGFSLAELHEVSTGPPLQPIKAPLVSFLSL